MKQAILVFLGVVATAAAFLFTNQPFLSWLDEQRLLKRNFFVSDSNPLDSRGVEVRYSSETIIRLNQTDKCQKILAYADDEEIVDTIFYAANAAMKMLQVTTNEMDSLKREFQHHFLVKSEYFIQNYFRAIANEHGLEYYDEMFSFRLVISEFKLTYKGEARMEELRVKKLMDAQNQSINKVLRSHSKRLKVLEERDTVRVQSHAVPVEPQKRSLPKATPKKTNESLLRAAAI